MKERISVLVYAYQAQDTLKTCVQSILCQTEQVDEIWVVDDGSTDDTLKTALSLAQQYPQIHLLAQKNHGRAFSRNRMLDEVSGEWLLFMEADEVLKKCALANLLKTARLQHAMIASETGLLTLMNRCLTGKQMMKQLLYHPELNRLSGKLFHRRLFHLLRFETAAEYSEMGIMAQLFLLSKRVAFMNGKVIKPCGQRMKNPVEQGKLNAMIRQNSIIVHHYPSLSGICLRQLRKYERKMKWKHKITSFKEKWMNTAFMRNLITNL